MKNYKMFILIFILSLCACQPANSVPTPTHVPVATPEMEEFTINVREPFVRYEYDTGVRVESKNSETLLAFVADATYMPSGLAHIKSGTMTFKKVILFGNLQYIGVDQSDTESLSTAEWTLSSKSWRVTLFTLTGNQMSTSVYYLDSLWEKDFGGRGITLPDGDHSINFGAGDGMIGYLIEWKY